MPFSNKRNSRDDKSRRISKSSFKSSGTEGRKSRPHKASPYSGTPAGPYPDKKSGNKHSDRPESERSPYGEKRKTFNKRTSDRPYGKEKRTYQQNAGAPEKIFRGRRATASPKPFQQDPDDNGLIRLNR